MPADFNINAQLKVTGPAGLGDVLKKIRTGLNSLRADVKINTGQTNKNLDNTNGKLLILARNAEMSTGSVGGLNQSLSQLSATLKTVNSNFSNASQGTKKVATALDSAGESSDKAGKDVQAFSEFVGIATRRFGAFAVVLGSVGSALFAIQDGLKEAAQFQANMIKLKQVGDDGQASLKGMSNEITRLSTNLGVSSLELSEVATTLRQANLSARETKIALEVLAKTNLAPSFENMKDSGEALIAIMGQFSLPIEQAEASFNAINKVSKDFAIEAGDITEAVRRAGGVFHQAGGNLNEFMSLLTSVRQTTRLSAETIATGFNTIFSKIRDPGTIARLREFGIELQDAFGEHIGPVKSLEAINKALEGVSSKQGTFAAVMKEVGDRRQQKILEPLIRQTALQQKAMQSAQMSQGDLDKDAVISQEKLIIQLTKLREKFLELFRILENSGSFKNIITLFGIAAEQAIGLAKALEPVLPIITTLLAAKAALGASAAIKNFAIGLTGVNRGKKFAGGGSTAETVPAWLTPGEFVFTPQDAKRIGYSKLAHMNKTGKYAQGGPVSPQVYASSGLVANQVQSNKHLQLAMGGPSGTDTVPALLPSGAFVVKRDSVQKIGHGKLKQMSRYAKGGRIGYYSEGGDVNKSTEHMKLGGASSSIFKDYVDQDPYLARQTKLARAMKSQFDGVPQPTVFEGKDIHAHRRDPYTQFMSDPSKPRNVSRLKRLSKGFAKGEKVNYYAEGSNIEGWRGVSRNEIKSIAESIEQKKNHKSNGYYSKLSAGARSRLYFAVDDHDFGPGKKHALQYAKMSQNYLKSQGSISRYHKPYLLEMSVPGEQVKNGPFPGERFVDELNPQHIKNVHKVLTSPYVSDNMSKSKHKLMERYVGFRKYLKDKGYVKGGIVYLSHGGSFVPSGSTPSEGAPFNYDFSEGGTVQTLAKGGKLYNSKNKKTHIGTDFGTSPGKMFAEGGKTNLLRTMRKEIPDNKTPIGTIYSLYEGGEATPAFAKGGSLRTMKKKVPHNITAIGTSYSLFEGGEAMPAFAKGGDVLRTMRRKRPNNKTAIGTSYSLAEGGSILPSFRGVGREEIKALAVAMETSKKHTSAGDLGAGNLYFASNPIHRDITVPDSQKINARTKALTYSFMNITSKHKERPNNRFRSSYLLDVDVPKNKINPLFQSLPNEIMTEEMETNWIKNITKVTQSDKEPWEFDLKNPINLKNKSRNFPKFMNRYLGLRKFLKGKGYVNGGVIPTYYAEGGKAEKSIPGTIKKFYSKYDVASPTRKIAESIIPPLKTIAVESQKILQSPENNRLEHSLKRSSTLRKVVSKRPEVKDKLETIRGIKLAEGGNVDGIPYKEGRPYLSKMLKRIFPKAKLENLIDESMVVPKKSPFLKTHKSDDNRGLYFNDGDPFNPFGGQRGIVTEQNPFIATHELGHSIDDFIYRKMGEKQPGRMASNVIDSLPNKIAENYLPHIKEQLQKHYQPHEWNRESFANAIAYYGEEKNKGFFGKLKDRITGRGPSPEIKSIFKDISKLQKIYKFASGGSVPFLTMKRKKPHNKSSLGTSYSMAKGGSVPSEDYSTHKGNKYLNRLLQIAFPGARLNNLIGNSIIVKPGSPHLRTGRRDMPYALGRYIPNMGPLYPKYPHLEGKRGIITTPDPAVAMHELGHSIDDFIHRRITGKPGFASTIPKSIPQKIVHKTSDFFVNEIAEAEPHEWERETFAHTMSYYGSNKLFDYRKNLGRKSGKNPFSHPHMTKLFPEIEKLQSTYGFADGGEVHYLKRGGHLTYAGKKGKKVHTGTDFGVAPAMGYAFGGNVQRLAEGGDVEGWRGISKIELKNMMSAFSEGRAHRHSSGSYGDQGDLYLAIGKHGKETGKRYAHTSSIAYGEKPSGYLLGLNIPASHLKQEKDNSIFPDYFENVRKVNPMLPEHVKSISRVGNTGIVGRQKNFPKFIDRYLGFRKFLKGKGYEQGGKINYYAGGGDIKGHRGISRDELISIAHAREENRKHTSIGKNTRGQGSNIFLAVNDPTSGDKSTDGMRKGRGYANVILSNNKSMRSAYVLGMSVPKQQVLPALLPDERMVKELDIDHIKTISKITRMSQGYTKAASGLKQKDFSKFINRYTGFRKFLKSKGYAKGGEITSYFAKGGDILPHPHRSHSGQKYLNRILQTIFPESKLENLIDDSMIVPHGSPWLYDKKGMKYDGIYRNNSSRKNTNKYKGIITIPHHGTAIHEIAHSVDDFIHRQMQGGKPGRASNIKGSFPNEIAQRFWDSDRSSKDRIMASYHKSKFLPESFADAIQLYGQEKLFDYRKDLKNKFGRKTRQQFSLKISDNVRGIFNDISTLPKIYGFAKGGKINYYAEGGGPKGTDTVPAWLTPGEFVINRKDAQRIGYHKLEKWNKGKYAEGGEVAPTVDHIPAPRLSRHFLEGGDAEGTVTQTYIQSKKPLSLKQKLKQHLKKTSWDVGIPSPFRFGEDRQLSKYVKKFGYFDQKGEERTIASFSKNEVVEFLKRQGMDSPKVWNKAPLLTQVHDKISTLFDTIRGGGLNNIIGSMQSSLTSTGPGSKSSIAKYRLDVMNHRAAKDTLTRRYKRGVYSQEKFEHLSDLLQKATPVKPKPGGFFSTLFGKHFEGGPVKRYAKGGIVGSSYLAGGGISSRFTKGGAVGSVYLDDGGIAGSRSKKARSLAKKILAEQRREEQQFETQLIEQQKTVSEEHKAQKIRERSKEIYAKIALQKVQAAQGEQTYAADLPAQVKEVHKVASANVYERPPQLKAPSMPKALPNYAPGRGFKMITPYDLVGTPPVVQQQQKVKLKDINQYMTRAALKSGQGAGVTGVPITLGSVPSPVEPEKFPLHADIARVSKKGQENQGLVNARVAAPSTTSPTGFIGRPTIVPPKDLTTYDIDQNAAKARYQGSFPSRGRQPRPEPRGVAQPDFVGRALFGNEQEISERKIQKILAGRADREKTFVGPQMPGRAPSLGTKASADLRSSQPFENNFVDIAKSFYRPQDKYGNEKYNIEPTLGPPKPQLSEAMKRRNRFFQRTTDLTKKAGEIVRPFTPGGIKDRFNNWLNTPSTPKPAPVQNQFGAFAGALGSKENMQTKGAQSGRFSGSGGFSGLGGVAMAAGFATPYLAETFLGSAQNQKRGEGAARAGSVIGGAAGGASIGAFGGPWLALAGAIGGATSSLMNFNEEIREIKLEALNKKIVEASSGFDISQGRFKSGEEEKFTASIDEIVKSIGPIKEARYGYGDNTLGTGIVGQLFGGEENDISRLTMAKTLGLSGLNGVGGNAIHKFLFGKDIQDVQMETAGEYHKAKEKSREEQAAPAKEALKKTLEGLSSAHPTMDLDSLLKITPHAEKLKAALDKITKLFGSEFKNNIEKDIKLNQQKVLSDTKAMSMIEDMMQNLDNFVNKMNLSANLAQQSFRATQPLFDTLEGKVSAPGSNMSLASLGPEGAMYENFAKPGGQFDQMKLAIKGAFDAISTHLPGAKDVEEIEAYLTKTGIFENTVGQQQFAAISQFLRGTTGEEDIRKYRDGNKLPVLKKYEGTGQEIVDQTDKSRAALNQTMSLFSEMSVAVQRDLQQGRQSQNVTNQLRSQAANLPTEVGSQFVSGFGVINKPLSRRDSEQVMSRDSLQAAIASKNARESFKLQQRTEFGIGQGKEESVGALEKDAKQSFDAQLKISKQLLDSSQGRFFDKDKIDNLTKSLTESEAEIKPLDETTRHKKTVLNYSQKMLNETGAPGIRQQLKDSEEAWKIIKDKKGFFALAQSGKKALTENQTADLKKKLGGIESPRGFFALNKDVQNKELAFNTSNKKLQEAVAKRDSVKEQLDQAKKGVLPDIEVRKLNDEFISLSANTDRVIQSLENLANNTTKLAAKQNELNIAMRRQEGDKAARMEMGEVMAFGTQQEKMQLVMAKNLTDMLGQEMVNGRGDMALEMMNPQEKSLVHNFMKSNPDYIMSARKEDRFARLSKTPTESTAKQNLEAISEFYAPPTNARQKRLANGQTVNADVFSSILGVQNELNTKANAQQALTDIRSRKAAMRQNNQEEGMGEFNQNISQDYNQLLYNLTQPFSNKQISSQTNTNPIRDVQGPINFGSVTTQQTITGQQATQINTGKQQLASKMVNQNEQPQQQEQLRKNIEKGYKELLDGLSSSFTKSMSEAGLAFANNTKELTNALKNFPTTIKLENNGTHTVNITGLEAASYLKGLDQKQFEQALMEALPKALSTEQGKTALAGAIRTMPGVA